MKKLLYILIAISFISFAACDQLEQSTSPAEKENTPAEKSMYSSSTSSYNVSAIEQVLSDHYARIALKGDIATIQKSTIVVPDDYATIQGAVDAAGTGSNILVKKGTYTENVVVTTEGLDIKATGNVVLNGRFYINADNVKIRNFEVNVGDPFAEGIYFWESENGEAKNNTVYGARVGIWFYYSDNGTIKNNVTYNNYWGIANPFSKGTEIKNNESYDNSIGFSIEWADESEVKENSIYDNNQGINLFDVTNSEFKDNNLNNNGFGGFNLINVGIGSSYNLFDGNTSNYNDYGIYINSGCDNNMIKNNTFKYNTNCDIVNFGANNTFMNSDADCTQGI